MSAGAKSGGAGKFLSLQILLSVGVLVISSNIASTYASREDPWAKLEDSPSMTCLDNEAELNRMWVESGDLYWDSYGNVTQICKALDAANEAGNECVVRKRDGSNEWYFKIAATDSGATIVAENFFNFDIGQWDMLLNISGMSERATFPCW